MAKSTGKHNKMFGEDGEGSRPIESRRRVSEEDKKKVEQAILWLKNNQRAEKEEYQHQLKELEKLFNLIISRTYQGGHRPEPINCALLNIDRLTVTKTEQLRGLISDKDLNFIFLTETWLNGDTAVDMLLQSSPNGFTYHYVNRPVGIGGGVAVIYSERYSLSEPCQFGVFTSFEYLALKIKPPNDLLIVIVYRPPGGLRLDFYPQFGEMLSIICPKYAKIIIAGDFNFPEQTKSFLKLFTNFKPHVNVPTHNQRNTLDLVFSKDIDVGITSIDSVDFSDHYCILFTTNPNTLPPSNTGLEDDLAGLRL